MSHTSSPLERTQDPEVEHFDFLIVGTVISGIGAGYHLQEPA